MLPFNLAQLSVFGYSLACKPKQMTDFIPVDVMSAEQVNRVMAGLKDGKKENQKPLVEKVAEAKPVDDTVGKISEKPPVVTETAPPKSDAPDEAAKAAEAAAAAKAKADAKAKAEADKAAKAEADRAKAEADKAKAEAKARAEKAKAEAKARAEAKAKADAEAKAKSENAMATISQALNKPELLNKKDPTRTAAAGDVLNSSSAQGVAKGAAADNSATWGALFRQQVERCWKKPYGGVEQQMAEAVFSIRLKRDGSLEGTPVAIGSPKTPYLRVYQESGLRAIIECAPYKLPPQFFDEWQFFEPAFTEKNMS
ncbi:cell envelope integrity protein TolA [Bradyrhizobium jicamae]|nr:cell envelope integrity protein TolA [Bradyrhizobium jicamae]MBR0755997.1 cell envelope integrity protein TolA [Bradyrhizobium jicamae]